MSAYWNSKGRFQEEFNGLFEKLVPVSGNCETLVGEAIRAANRVYYDAFNNGFCNNTSGAVNFLRTYIAPQVNDANFDEALAYIAPKTNTGGYSRVTDLTGAALDCIIDTVVQYSRVEGVMDLPAPCDLFDLQEPDEYEEEEEEDYDYEYE